QVSAVEKLDVIDGGKRIRARRALDDGYEVVECPLPALVTVAEGIAPEVHPSPDEIKAAMDRPITEITAAELSNDLSIFGQAGSPTWVSEIRIIESSRAQRIVENVSPEEATREVVAFLNERGVL